MTKLKFCTLNANGLKVKDKFLRVEEWLKSQKADIAFIQETHFNAEIKQTYENISKFKIFSSYGTTATKGAAILIKNSLNFKIIDETTDTDGRFILLNVNIDETIYSLVCVYAPNDRKTRNSYFKSKSDVLQNKSLGIKVIGGDFNEALNPIDRKLARTRDFVKPVYGLKTFINTHNLIDIWRDFQVGVKQFTWRRKNSNQASRIDMILIERDFKSKCVSCKIHPAMIKYTDHQGVSLIYEQCSDSKGRGFGN